MRVFTRPQMKPWHHVHSLSTPRSLHADEPQANMSTHVQPQVHSLSTPRSLHAHEPQANMSTHVQPQVHSLSTPRSLHAHEPSANISTHIPPPVHSVSTPMSLHVHEPYKQTYQLMHHQCTAYQHLCRFMYMNHISKHINSCTTSAQHINTYVASCT